MVEFPTFNFSDLYYSDELNAVGIKSTSDLIKPAIIAFLKDGIQQHIQSCNLSKSACNEILSTFEAEGFEVSLDQNICPDIRSLPVSFSNVDSEEDAEHQRALNYASWVVPKMPLDKEIFKSTDKKDPTRAFPLNLLNAIFGVDNEYQFNSPSLCTIIQETIDDLLSFVTPGEERTLASIYKDGISINDIICTLGLQHHEVAAWAVEESVKKVTIKALRKLRHPSRSKCLIDFLSCISYLESVDGATLEDIKKSFLCEEALSWTTAQGEKESLAWKHDSRKSLIQKLLNTDEIPAKFIYYAHEFEWCSWPVGLLTGLMSPGLPSSKTRDTIEKAYFSTNPIFGHYFLLIGRTADNEDICSIFEFVDGELRNIQVDVGILKNLRRIIEKKTTRIPRTESLRILYNAEQQFCEKLSKQAGDAKERAFYQMSLELINESLSNLSASGLRSASEIPIDEMGLSVRAYNCLRRANINTLEDLISKTKGEMMQVRNLGRHALDEVIQIMGEYGFALKPSEEDSLNG